MAYDPRRARLSGTVHRSRRKHPESTSDEVAATGLRLRTAGHCDPMGADARWVAAPPGRVVRANDEDIVVTRLTRDRLAECLDGIVILDAAIRAELGSTYSEEEWGAEQFQREMPGKFQHSLVILGTEGVAAYLIASRPQPDMLHIHRLAVAASTRDKGLATRLMDTLVKRARREGVRLIRLKVHPSNRAARVFYGKLGFTPMEASRGDSDASHDHLFLTLGREARVKILAVGAHLDDVEIACGGTVARAVAAQHEVKMLILSDSSYASYDGQVHRTVAKR